MKKKKVNRNTHHISSIKRLTRKFLEVLRSSRAKQRQSNVQKSVLNVQSCFFANYDLKNNLRELRFQPWLNQCIKLSFSLFYSSFIFKVFLKNRLWSLFLIHNSLRISQKIKRKIILGKPSTESL